MGKLVNFVVEVVKEGLEWLVDKLKSLASSLFTKMTNKIKPKAQELEKKLEKGDFTSKSDAELQINTFQRGYKQTLRETEAELDA